MHKEFLVMLCSKMGNILNSLTLWISLIRMSRVVVFTMGDLCRGCEKKLLHFPSKSYFERFNSFSFLVILLLNLIRVFRYFFVAVLVSEWSKER